MLLPLSWLREFTPYEGTAEALGDRLTMLGLELEDIQRPYAGISSIVIGFVAECTAHPDSDHLHCCKVDVGQGELLPIVCGAPNVAAGQFVPVAPVGSRLPDGMLIKKARLRGQPSWGMICSERELGLSDDHGGIMVLPDWVEPGKRLVDALKLDDEVLDIAVTPNRGDCLSVLGLARETAAACRLPLRIPDLPLIFAEKNELRVPELCIEEPELCWLYSGRVMFNVSIAPSPLAVRLRLRSIGVRAISNVVDITNYILYECGQPLHAFDLDRLAGPSINVRCAGPGESLRTLDGQIRRLEAGDLCICDARGPVALAGIMGGEESEIGPRSTHVFLESAVFRPQTIRRTARRLGLSTEASYRYERGVDQQRTVWALDRACALLGAQAGARVQKEAAFAEPRPWRPVFIDFSPDRANAVLGLDLSADFDRETLIALGCSVEESSVESWRVQAPSWRHDLTRGADLAEELGRMYGLDNIEPRLPALRKSMDEAGRPESMWTFARRIRHWGAGLGLNEIVNYSFVSEEDLTRLGEPEQGRIRIMNPLSEEQSVLRSSLAPGLLHSLRVNLAQGSTALHLFEIASVFTADDAAGESGALESPSLGLLLYGSRRDGGWPGDASDLGYADMKGLVANLLRFLRLRLEDCPPASEPPFLSPCAAIVTQAVRVGHMGRVRPGLAGDFHAQKDVWLAELDLDQLLRLHAQTATVFRPLPIYPPVRRDMTVIAPSALKAREIEEQLRAVAPAWLEGLALADCFEPNAGQERHLTYRLTFRHPERTLVDEEVDRQREKIAAALMAALPVKI